MTNNNKGCSAGLDHVALQAGDIDHALGFYGQFLEFGLCGMEPEAML